MIGNFKATLAEFLGTFTLIFIGAGAGAITGAGAEGLFGAGWGPGAGPAGLLCVAWAHGLALLVIVYAWGSISGAHVNPAVTFGIALAGRMDWAKAILYWIAQFVGAIAAAYLIQYLLPPGAGLGETIGLLTPSNNAPGDPTKVVVLEAVLTFFLVTAVFASGVHGRNGNMAGIAIGLVLTMDILVGGPLTGASMNPARTFGPALAAHHLDYFWMYVVGPLIGGGVAALVYDRLFLPAEQQPPLQAASGR